MKTQNIVRSHADAVDSLGYGPLATYPMNYNDPTSVIMNPSNGTAPLYNYNIWNPSFSGNNIPYLNSQQLPRTNYTYMQRQPNQQQVSSPEQTEILINKLNDLSVAESKPKFQNNHHNTQRKPSVPHDDNVFHLPLELQGGLSNINSRRPSFTAEKTLTSSSNNGFDGRFNSTARNNMELYAHSNNFNNGNSNGLNNLNGGGAYNIYEPFKNSTDLMNDFRSRRPSMQINPQTAIPIMNTSGASSFSDSSNIRSIDNGLLLNKENRILTSSELRVSYQRADNYFAVDSCEKFYGFLKGEVATNLYLSKVILNLKKLNNIFNLPNRLMLALTKAGKFELLSFPISSTLLIKKGDLVLCDGDRGKDLVYVLDAELSLDLAILINYLKKKLHSKSLNYCNDEVDNNQSFKGKTISNTIYDLVNGLGILDEETQFQIPLKLVLRFANVHEVQNLKYKLIEEIKSLKTCILKISNNNDDKLRENLIIKNSEYQFDEKKLIFYYYSKGGKRLDFRMLIKELFKIYKTRIWLCAILNPVPNTAVDSEVDYSWINSVNINTVELETFSSDDFHVTNLQLIYEELLGTTTQHNASEASSANVKNVK